MESLKEPRFLKCLFKPRSAFCFDFFTLKSGIAFGCIFDILIGLLRLLSLIFRPHRHFLRVFQGITAPAVAVCAVLCLIGLSKEKIVFVKSYWVVKILDSCFAAVASYLFYQHECSHHECKLWLFLALGFVRIGYNLLFSHMAWSATYYLKRGQKLLVMHGPQVLELMGHQASSIAFTPVSIVEGQALPTFTAGASINS
mmetsp:Transcript_1574/g.3361  ORF Transcript_1574/g.3361 Transcript_1574/m.3361 type:complete len:199 (+) Transcript_1574:1166-1762(+)